AANGFPHALRARPQYASTQLESLASTSLNARTELPNSNEWSWATPPSNVARMEGAHDVSKCTVPRPAEGWPPGCAGSAGARSRTPRRRDRDISISGHRNHVSRKHNGVANTRAPC